MAAAHQITRLIALASQEATSQHPADVDRRSTAFAQMLCGALECLELRDAAKAVRVMLGVRQPCDGA